MSRLFGIFDENLILIIMSWLDLRDHGLLDLALTNVVERKRWMICLSSAHLNSNLRTIQCTHSLLRWLIKRKMQPEVISCNGSCVEDDRAFVGIDNKSLHTLGLTNSRETDAGLLMIARGCPQLKDITLGGCKKISDEGLLALAVNLPGMTSIDLCLTSNMTHVGVSAIAERCPALVKISILQGDQRTAGSVTINDSIQAIAWGCPKLQTISISDGYWLSDESVAFLADRCNELRSVRLVECDLVTDESIRAIANSCPDLEKLDVSGRLTTGRDNKFLHFSQITDESFIIVGQRCSKLVDISFALQNVTDIGIAALARGCPQLRSFSAHDCPSISTDGITALSHGCKELRTINLCECGLITDDSLFRIAEACPELTSFTLSRISSVTNAGISCIAKGCEKLLYITIENCRQTDDTALIAIGSSCPNLLGIKITSNYFTPSSKYSDRGLIAIACGCSALESISILECPNITDAGVIVLAQKCLDLKSVTLSSSRMITNASLIAFATNSHKLQSVSISCNKMEGKVNLLSLRRKYSLAKTSEHYRHTSVLSMLWHFISWK